MDVSSIMPRYFQRVNYSKTADATTLLICPKDYRRTYVRIVLGLAGIGLNSGVFLGGNDNRNLFIRPSSGQVIELKWVDLQVLVCEEIWISDVAVGAEVTAYGVVCIEDTIRSVDHATREKQAYRARSQGNPWHQARESIRSRSQRSGQPVKTLASVLVDRHPYNNHARCRLQ